MRTCTIWSRPAALAAVLDLLAAEPGAWTPIAGGTELMVAFAAGRLTAPKLVSLWGIPDLRTIEVTATKASSSAPPPRFSICAGTPSSPPIFRCSPKPQAGSAPSPTRAAPRSAAIWSTARLPRILLLRCWPTTRRSSSSPCAARRRVPYSEFHTGYKRNVLAADELLYAIHLPRRFARHRQYLRKVGTRRAMAIAKVALGATALLENGVIREIRLGAASLAPFPARFCRLRRRCSARRSRATQFKPRAARCSPK